MAHHKGGITIKTIIKNCNNNQSNKFKLKKIFMYHIKWYKILTDFGYSIAPAAVFLYPLTVP